MNIKNIIKIAAVFAGVTAAFVVADKVIDRVVDGKHDENDICEQEVDLDDVETDKTSKVDNAIATTVVKAAIKSVIVTVAGLVVYECGLENGVVAGAAFFTKTPTTYEEATELVCNPDTFHEIMTLIRKVR